QVEGDITDLDRSDKVLPGTDSSLDPSSLESFLGFLIPQGFGHLFPGFALETINSSEIPAEGECCGSCSPPPAPPLISTVFTVEESSFTTVELCQDGEVIFLRAKEGDVEEKGGQYPNCEDLTRKHQRVPFQIFPDPVEVVLGPATCLNSLERDREKERLPSIVVEPTEVSEVESGELRWPPESIEIEDEEEDLFLEQCIPPANIADWGEEEEEDEEEETSVILNQQSGLTLIDLQSDAFRDETPTLPPNSAPAFN
uniref:LBH domain-containing protein n=1 Tax=Nothobranchius furzeri TaxID=105023 RepID=A0A8C6NKP4_NOTFU